MNYANVRCSVRSRSHRIKGLLTRRFGPFRSSVFRGREELLSFCTKDFLTLKTFCMQMSNAMSNTGEKVKAGKA